MSDPADPIVGVYSGEPTEQREPIKEMVPIGRKLLRIEELDEEHPDFKEAGEWMGYTIRLVYNEGPPTLIHGNHDGGPDIVTGLEEKRV